MEWQIKEFTGTGEEVNRLFDYLLEEGVDEPTAVVTNFERPAVSKSCNDPDEVVKPNAIFDENLDVFRRNFTGSAIYLDPADVHMVFAHPVPEYSGGPVENVHPFIKETLEELDIETVHTGDSSDYALRVDGYPLADFNWRQKSKASVAPGFVSAEPWDLNTIDSYISLRGDSERDYISRMSSLSELADVTKQDYLQAVYEVAGQSEADSFELPDDYVSSTTYSDTGYFGPYTGWCAATDLDEKQN